MSRASAAKEKAARLAAQRHAPVVDPHRPADAALEELPDQRPVEPAAVVGERRPVPAVAERKTVRTTLDLAAPLYEDFEDWRRDAAKQLRQTVKSAAVLRVLLRRLLSDPELAAAVLEDLRREGRG